MAAEKLNSMSLLKELVYSENPTEVLAKKFNNITPKEEIELREVINELLEKGYIKVLWANNKPYNVAIKNDGKMYVQKIDSSDKSGGFEVQANENSKIFISHRTIDAKIADALYDFLVATGISGEKIFCSSLPGNDVKQHISYEVKEAIKNSCLNIAILSQNYYDSAYCLNEAGVFWFQDTPVIPIALPEIEHKDMVGFLDSNYKIRRLDNMDDIAYIYDSATKETQSKQAPMAITSRETQKLIERYNELVNNGNTPKLELYKNPTIENSIAELTTDDEKIVLYYILENKVRKITNHQRLLLLKNINI